jgi:hypothetical protein
MTTIIRAESAHDFLALVPALVGYRPARSVLCVAFSGNRTGGVLRHDLPETAAAADALVRSVVGTVCRLPDADAVVPVVYTERRFDGGGIPHRDLLDDLVRRAEEAGFLVRDALCVGADGWGSLLDEELPPGGRPLSLIDDSPAALRADEHGPFAESPTALVRVPEPDPALVREMDRMLAALGRVNDALGAPDATIDRRDGVALDTVAAIEQELGDGLDPVVAGEQLAEDESRSAARLAWLIHLLGCPAFRDAIMLQVAFGAVIGELALDSAEEAAERARQSGRTLDDLMHGEMDEAVVESVEEFLVRLLLGRAAARPDPERVGRALDTLVLAIANAPRAQRAGALCAASWLAWALGRGSAAGALVDLALESDPEHGMAIVLARLFGSGALPEWVFRSAVGAAERPEEPVSGR